MIAVSPALPRYGADEVGFGDSPASETSSDSALRRSAAAGRQPPTRVPCSAAPRRQRWDWSSPPTGPSAPAAARVRALPAGVCQRRWAGPVYRLIVGLGFEHP